VDCGFKCATVGFSYTVACHQQSLMTGCARIMEALLVRIRIVILGLVIKLVVVERLDDLNLSLESSPFCRSVGGIWYGRGRSSRR